MFIEIKRNYDGDLTTTIKFEEPTFVSNSRIESFKPDPRVITDFSLVETNDGKMLVRFQPDDYADPVCYSHSDACIPLFIYFTTESIESERNHGEILESYTIIIVYQHEIVKLSLKKDIGYDIEFESCNVDRIGLFNNKSGMIIREYMFEICPEVENGMKGLAVHTGHDGQEVIEVIKFIFYPINFLKNVVIQWRGSITMPFNFRSNEISADCGTGLFSLTGSYCTDDNVLIIISREINKSVIEFDSRVILIYQKASMIVLVNYNNGSMKNRLDTAQYDHVGELIVSCKIPQFVQELKEIHKYIPQSDESDNGE